MRSDQKTARVRAEQDASLLTAQDLLAGSSVIHGVSVPAEILRPMQSGAPGIVRLRPLSVGVLSVISRAAREDAGLVPLLMIKESLVEPAVSLEQVRQMHIGLVHFLVSQINRISGLSPDGEALQDHVSSPLSQSHILLARHFGWTPEQVAQLTPAQVAVYLKGMEMVMAWERERQGGDE